MLRTSHKRALAGLAAAALIAFGTGMGTAVAREDTPARHDKLSLGEEEVKQLVLLMDQNKNGKVSEQEFMEFMKAEFKRLDKDKNGELDPKELTESQIRVSHFTAVGK